MATGDASWFGADEQVSRTRGRLFELGCLAATSVGILSVFVLLLYVATDAFRPLSADPGWHGVVFLTVVLPTAALAVHYYRTDGRAGEVAYTTTGLPVVGLLLAGGLLVLFAELFAVAEWFALVCSLALAAWLVYAHSLWRPAAVGERLVGAALTTAVVLFGAPPVSLALRLGIPIRVVSFRELILELPYLPLPSLQLVATLALPVAALAGWFVGRRRESRQDGAFAAGLIVLVAALGPVVGPLLGVGAVPWVVLVATTAVPTAVYVEEVLRRRDGLSGLAFPAVLAGGAVAAFLATQALGLAGPESWLDWSFLTSSTAREPEAAGIYPVLVGTVMLMLVIVLATFPVGVGAAIYLEEYAPAEGLLGRFVTLVEINIANLAGVPSVVYGLLGLAVFIRFFRMPTGSVVVGGLAVGLLILPIVIISAQEAIEAVPDSTREAAYGMGATRWQVVRDVVLPEALPGIMTGTILALGRAIGETAPLLMIGMAASVRYAPNGFFDKASAMPRQIFSWAFEIDPGFRYGALAAGVVTLLAVLLVMNATAIVVRNKYQRQT